MTRISAGSTLANQYAPPFVISKSVTTNWQLRYNANLLAFEAFDPSENIVEVGFDVIESQLFASVVNQQQFVLSWVAASKQSLYATINGVKQHTSTYGISTDIPSNTTTVTFGSPATGDIEFIGLQTTGGASINLYTATGDGIQTVFPSVGGSIGWLAPNAQSLLITIDGVKQDTTAYTIASNATFTGTELTFTGVPAGGAAIEVVGITLTGETPASPVQVANLAGGTGGAGSPTLGHARLFSAKTLSGETQIFSFRDLFEGANITLTEGANSITIEADQLTLDQVTLGGGTSLFDQNDPSAAIFRKVVAGDRIGLSVAGIDNPISIAYNIGWQLVVQGTDADPYVQLATDRLIGITNLTATQGVTLLDPSTVPDGDTVTIKNQTADTSTITLTPAAGLIDGVGTYVMNTAYGYVTLYSDGTNYYVISEG